MKRTVRLLLGVLILAACSFSARADESTIPLLPHPMWFSCQYSLECVPVAGACKGWQSVNKRYLGIAGRYYKYWQGKRDCSGAVGHKKSTSPLCVKGRCTFAE